MTHQSDENVYVWASNGEVAEFTNWNNRNNEEPDRTLFDDEVSYCVGIMVPDDEANERKWNVSPCSDNDTFALCKRGW